MPDCIRVPLTQGLFALIDAEDADRVLTIRWHAIRVRKRFYAATAIDGKRVYLHQFILPNVPEIDHVNRDGLDNQRKNLRSCTHAQNIANAHFPVGRSGYRGVQFHNDPKRVKRWQARIKVNQRNISLGYFATPEEAARAYDEGSRQHFGEFGWQNFPSEIN